MSGEGGDTEKNKELDALGVRHGRGTERESDTRLQPSNKNSAEQYMTAIIGTYGLDSHFPAVSLCLGIPNLQGSLFSTVHVVVPPALAPVTHIPRPLFLGPSHPLSQRGCAPNRAPFPPGPPPCGGTRPLLIINISRTRSRQKSGAANIVRTLTLGSSY